VNVVLLTREYPPEVYGGAGVHVDHLSRELARRADVTVRCFGGPRHVDGDDSLTIESFRPWEALAGLQPYMPVLQTLSVNLGMAAGLDDADVVHSHTWYANFAGHLANLLYEIPHVVTTHSLEPLRPWKAEQLGPGGYAVSSFCERVALESADAVIAVSEAMRDDVTRVYPNVDPSRICVIHNGIDTKTYRPVSGGDVPGRYGIDPDRPMVLFVGRIARQKGIVHLLEAARAFDRRAQLVLVASAPDTPEVLSNSAETDGTRCGSNGCS
jgi:starch synthase